MRCSAVVLAGGESSRMRRDKASLEIEGEPLWHRQLRILRKLNPERLMIAARKFDEPDCEITADAIRGAGPLAGIAGALQRSTSPLLVVLAIDLPNMTADFLGSLLDSCTETQGIVPRSSQGFEALAAVYPARSAALALECLRAGDYSMQQFVQRALDQGFVKERRIAPNEVDLFFNLNTPADYEKLEQRKIGSSR
jgi:molybdopterin-guanine dinucleotide biosynthesis protein A